MMLPSRHYVSAHTRFMRKLMEKNPALVERQQEGRALWWDKRPEDLALRRTMDEARVPRRGYAYFSE